MTWMDRIVYFLLGALIGFVGGVAVMELYFIELAKTLTK